MSRTAEVEWGLAAAGRSGAIQVDVHEACSGPERWELAIAHSRIYLRLEIPSPAVVQECAAFLQHHWNKPSFGELRLGSIGDSNISLIKDDEFVDRFFLCGAAENGVFRCTLHPDEIEDYIAAIRNALEDLRNAV